MDKKNLLNLIKTGEGLGLEFKSSLSKELKKEIKYCICAFANTSGGKILIGAEDDGNIVGVDYNNGVLAEVQHLGREVNPGLNLIIDTCEELKVIVIEVLGSEKIHSINGMFFVREGATTIKVVNPKEVRGLFELKNKISFEDKVNEKFDFDKDFNDGAYGDFLRLAKIDSKIEKRDLLKNLGVLVEDGKVTNAGALFFCEDIAQYVREGYITCVLYLGDSETESLDMKYFKKDFVSNIEGVIHYFKEKLNTLAIIEGLEERMFWRFRKRH